MQNYELHTYAFCSKVNNSRDLSESWFIIEDGIKKVINPTYAFFSNACIGTIVTNVSDNFTASLPVSMSVSYIKTDENNWEVKLDEG